MDSIVIVTKYHPATDRKGSRISATDPHGNRMYQGYNHALDREGNHKSAAETFAAKRLPGRALIGAGPINVGFVFLYN